MGFWVGSFGSLRMSDSETRILIMKPPVRATGGLLIDFGAAGGQYTLLCLCSTAIPKYGNIYTVLFSLARVQGVGARWGGPRP